MSLYDKLQKILGNNSAGAPKTKEFIKSLIFFPPGEVDIAFWKFATL